MVCAVGVCMVESILTMPVVTTLFRNLFDNIFTHFYGCWTALHGVGSMPQPDHTISHTVQKVDSVQNHSHPGRPRSTPHLTVYVCSVCACVLCLCDVYVCLCMCVLVCICVSTPWF